MVIILEIQLHFIQESDIVKKKTLHEKYQETKESTSRNFGANDEGTLTKP